MRFCKFMELKIGVFIVIILTVLQYLFIYKLSQKSNKVILMWWTPFIGNIEYRRQCGNVECLFTENHKYLDDRNLKGFLFYGSNMNQTNFPIMKKRNQIWAIYHEESPKNVNFLMYENIWEFFNYTSTFSRYSDLPLTLQYLESIDKLTDTTYLVSIGDKNNYQISEKLAPILYIQSICDTMSGRDNYVSELMNYINIDSYGNCLNNKNLTDSLKNDYLSKIDSDEFYHFVAKYKFVIAIENAVCNDYITEKLWRPLVAGVIPIYFGSPTVKDWLPNNDSAILISDFESIEQLADYIHYLNENDLEYNSFLDHKYNILNPISNKKLLKHIANRPYNIEETINTFECYVCEKAYKSENHIANKKHYDCEERLIRLNSSTRISDWWDDILKTGRCEADIISDNLLINKKVSKEEYNVELLSRYTQGIC